ncbi:hypothetical protein [Campylobacter sp. CCUG 57310]|uniref:hypothetical protein n=1 Tax=Campylobacter sp. CCUG 57310 TaxID=2517362 RepID=UPI001C2028DC|nr:hypothetical protein [Campylobacter sp. CCUG 57310]QKF91448.1 hypothetical protein CORI_0212 [Campylobacter sp. CCUG 57310]
MNSDNKSVSKTIQDIKDYANLADASYAFYNYVDNNEKLSQADKDYNENVRKKPRPVWEFADGERIGHKLKDDIKDEDGNILIPSGNPTAYALATEARFMQEKIIKRPKTIQRKQNLGNNNIEYEDIQINNNIKNFIVKDGDLQELFYKHSYLSTRTKMFSNRFRLIHHQENTSISGFSYTIFKDDISKSAPNRYTIAFRGTEAYLKGGEIFKDMILTDGFIAGLVGIPQIISLIILKKEMMSKIQEDFAKNNSNLNEKSNTSAAKFETVVVGHSLGGHLAQATYLYKNSLNIKELYTYNAPGFGGALASLFNILLRVVRVVVKFIIKGVKKLFDLFGFTRRVIDRCVNKVYGGGKTTDEVISECKEHTNYSRDFDEAAKNAKDAGKNSFGGIEIHHIETIKKAIPVDDFTINRESRQTIEPSVSVISDLGYKLGLGIRSKLDYKNTDRLHLLHIGELDGSYYLNSHYMTSIIYASHFYDYLLKQENNKNKEALSKDIACALDYLNSYSQILVDLIDKDKFYKDNINIKSKNQNYISIILDEMYYRLKNKKDNSEYKEFIDKYENNVNKVELVNIMLDLAEKEVFIKIIDKKDLEKEFEDDKNFRALFKMLPFVPSFKNDEKLDKNDITKAYKYNSNFTKTYLTRDKEKFLNAKKEQYKNTMFDDEFNSIYVSPVYNNKNYVRLNEWSSTVFVDTLNREIFVFSHNRDVVDCKSIYKRVEEKFAIQDDMSSYKYHIFLDGVLLSGAGEYKDTAFAFGSLDEGGNPDESKPVYYYQDNGEGEGTLRVFNKNSNVDILHYSLGDESLGIKLMPTHKSTMQKRELSRSIPKKREFDDIEKRQSIAVRFPIIEDDVVMCEHGGTVILKSVRGRTLRTKGIPIILGSDFINSPIINCPCNSPCTSVAVVPRSALSEKTVNNEHALMQDYISECLSDKGSKIICVKKPNDFKFFDSSQDSEFFDKQGNAQNEIQKSNIRVHFKSDASQKDNMLVCVYYLNDVKFEDKNGFSNIELDFNNANSVSDTKLLDDLKNNYKKNHEFKEFSLKFGKDEIKMVFIIPEYIHKVSKQKYNELNRPSSGIGYFSRLHGFDSTKCKKDYVVKTIVFYSPGYVKKTALDIAKGFDDDYAYEVGLCRVDITNSLKIG